MAMLLKTQGYDDMQPEFLETDVDELVSPLAANRIKHSLMKSMCLQNYFLSTYLHMCLKNLKGYLFNNYTTTVLYLASNDVSYFAKNNM